MDISNDTAAALEAALTPARDEAARRAAVELSGALKAHREKLLRKASRAREAVRRWQGRLRDLIHEQALYGSRTWAQHEFTHLQSRLNAHRTEALACSITVRLFDAEHSIRATYAVVPDPVDIDAEYAVGLAAKATRMAELRRQYPIEARP